LSDLNLVASVAEPEMGARPLRKDSGVDNMGFLTPVATITGKNHHEIVQISPAISSLKSS